MTTTLDNHWTGVTVSAGTMRPEDLIPIFMEILYNADESLVADLEEHFDTSTEADYDERHELLDTLFDRLNDVAPEGTVFGAHDGDGACYGFWPI
jgi:hypothetical protein